MEARLRRRPAQAVRGAGRSGNWCWRAMAARPGACSKGPGGARVDAARERVVRQLAAGGGGRSGRAAAAQDRQHARRRRASGTPGVRAAPEQGGAALMAVAGAGRVGAEAQEPERELGEHE
jgi:hypothetical protein